MSIYFEVCQTKLQIVQNKLKKGVPPTVLFIPESYGGVSLGCYIPCKNLLNDYVQNCTAARARQENDFSGLEGLFWMPFGSWCRVQPQSLWLVSNSDTTWLDCLWHASEARKRLFLQKTPIAFPLKRAGNPQGSVISPALFNHFVSDCPIPDLSMTSYAENFTLLAFAPSIASWRLR